MDKCLKGSITLKIIPPALNSSLLVIVGLLNIKPTLPSGRYKQQVISA